MKRWNVLVLPREIAVSCKSPANSSSSSSSQTIFYFRFNSIQRAHFFGRGKACFLLIFELNSTSLESNSFQFVAVTFVAEGTLYFVFQYNYLHRLRGQLSYLRNHSSSTLTRPPYLLSPATHPPVSSHHDSFHLLH